MPPPNSRQVITRERYDAVLFDLDGVITDTASLHAAFWKKMFDDYLKTRAVTASGSTCSRYSGCWRQ